MRYGESLKTFVFSLIQEKSGLDTFEKIKEKLTSIDWNFDDGLLQEESGFLRANNEKLLSYMMEKDMFPAIVFVFNRHYCPRLVRPYLWSSVYRIESFTYEVNIHHQLSFDLSWLAENVSKLPIKI